jgi:hypothetical protein
MTHAKATESMQHNCGSISWLSRRGNEATPMVAAREHHESRGVVGGMIGCRHAGLLCQTGI